MLGGAKIVVAGEYWKCFREGSAGLGQECDGRGR